jgi:proteasome lid subunit RPN8/RPN11
MLILKIPFKVLDALKKYGDEFPYEEVGGILLGRIQKDGYHQVRDFCPVKNIGFTDSRIDYNFDPQTIYNNLKYTTIVDPGSSIDLVGIFHTHPYNKPMASLTDIEYAGYRGFYLIYSPLYNDFNNYYSYGSNDKDIRHAINARGEKNFEPATIVLS